MRTFECVCENVLFFENSLCTQCDREVGWCPACEAIAPIEPMAQGDGWRCLLPGCGAELSKCDNYRVEGVCNRMVPRGTGNATPGDQAGPRQAPRTTAPQAAEPQTAAPQTTTEQILCDCCRHNAVIPDLSVAGHRERWARLEEAKRRLFFQLDAMGLPRGDGLDPPLRFEFMTDALPTATPGVWRPSGGDQVMTGHADGTVTINVREADDAERARMRMQMGEDYRTLLGHFRHEIGHYYWEVLIAPDPDRLARFVALFGDPESPTYAEALDRHYREGPPANWIERYTTEYATMHPWEDWAETWAAYLEVLSTIDTAAHLGFGRRRASPYEQPVPMDELLARYRALGIDLNEINRAMGLMDLLTRNFPAPVIEKLHFVDEVVRAAS